MHTQPEEQQVNHRRAPIIAALFLLAVSSLPLAVLTLRSVSKLVSPSTPTQPVLSLETAEQAALRFIETVTRLHSREQAYPMLCAEGYPYHQPNVNREIEFWSRPEVMVQPHDFRVVKSLVLPPDVADDYKIWVAFRYTYRYQGKPIDIDLSDGWTVYVTQRADGYCISPWAGG